MKRLRDCLNKTVGKLITREDADHLWQSAKALEAGGLTPIEAERQAVQNAIEQATNNGESILNQIRGQRPAAYSQARNFWEQETIRKPGMPPPLPRFVTEAAYAPRRAATTPAAPVPAEEIVAVHNAPDKTGSTINAVHGNLIEREVYSVSIFPDLGITSPGKNITVEQINAFAAKAQAAGLDVSSPNLSIGTWWDAETDTTYIDIAFTTTDRAAAIAFGQQFNQKAIYDLKLVAEIPTWGTGVAPKNLPSIAERIGILFPPGYDVGRNAEPTTITQAEASAGPPPGSTTGPPTEAGVPRGAGEVQPELGGIQQEAPGTVTPPEIPAAPISDAAQEVVNSLPEEQRNAAQKAFARDDRDPLADDQRSRGQPVEKRRNAPVAPEKNKGLLAELSKYGVWDKPVTEVLKNIASDPRQPRWVRALTDLLVQLGLGEGVDIRVVNTPNATWPALYVSNKETKRGTVYINLSYKGDLARRLLHELLHHGTLTKLTDREGNLTPAELTAKRALQDMFDIVRKRGEFEGVYGASNLQEFVSEVFANDNFRRKLNSIRPDGRVSLLQRFADAVRDLLIGDLPMRRGSLLDAAIKEAINVAGSRAVETSPRADAAEQERRTRAAQQANEHPNFQEEISNVAAMADNMGISDNDLIARKLDHEAAFYADEERKAVEAAVDERAGKINATPAEIADVKKRIEDDILYNRAYHSANEGWANKAIKVLGLEDKKGLTRGDPTKQNPSGIAFKIKYKDTPYTYARDTEGKPIQRFLKQGKPDKETGKPVDNPEWGKRAGQLANKMFDNLQGIMARRGKGGNDARVAQVIVDQINWYRDMRTRLRAEFGSMSDYVADVIAGFSPITDVPGNWNNFIDYFRHVMRGDYDEAFRKFDEYISADPENRSSGTYKKEFPPEDFPDLWPRKLLKEDQPLFGANTGNALMAGLDLWRAVQSGTAPKARNFGLNLIGQSLKATIDRWAGRYLQRMHAPTWRIPPSIEGAVTGTHMTGGNVELVSGDFGMGQDVFENVAARLREGGHEIFKEVTPADLQAILWFAEKEVWEMRKWTDIMGAGSSMNVVAQATAAQRYEAGTVPGKTNAKDEKLMAETIELRTNLNAEAHMLGAKMVPSVNITDGKESKTFDGEWITEPEYDPENSIGYVAKVAARLGKKAAHISRVIVNPYEVNDNITPGLHIFFKGRVGDAEIKRVLSKLKTAGITDGISLTVDPRVRPEIIKSLDPRAGANQYNGLRIQFILEYGAAEGMTRDQIEKTFRAANDVLAKDASIAESRVLYYDTLVLKKGTDYDNGGKLTKNASEGRARVWAERARNEGSEAAARRDDVIKAIEDRKRQDRELESRMDREQQERIARFAEFQRRVQPKDRAIDGGVDPSTVAAMQYEDEQKPVRDPHGGRESLVRSMVDRIRNTSRDERGIEVPESAQEVRGVAGAGGRPRQKGSGSAPIWRSLGTSFRKREAALARRLGAASDLISAGKTDEEKEATKYADSQRLFDYLLGKETPEDPELRDVIAELRKEIPVIPQAVFRKLQHLDVGSEADVYHDPEGGVVYKVYGLHEGKFSGWVPGPLRLREDGEVGVGMAGDPTFAQFIGRMERSNAHGLTPSELIAMTPEGHLVFAQPFAAGRGVTPKNSRAALARAGIHELTQVGGIAGVAKLDDGRWVLYDDLHKGNVRTMPGGRVEIIDANNRELDQYEINDLTTLGKMPPEKPLGPPRAKKPTKKSQNYDNATVIAPMVETHHGTPHEWAPEKRVRLADGTVEWMAMDRPTPSGATVIERAPAGRVRADKVMTGEGNAAYGWGVLYSAQRKGVAESYRNTLAAYTIDGISVEAFRKQLPENVYDIAKKEGIPFDQASARWQNIKPTVDAIWAIESHGDDAEFMLRSLEAKEALNELKASGRLKKSSNLYTLQLDVDDPELLDWFMPMKDQMHIFDKVAAQFGVTREQAQKANEHNEMLAELANNLQAYASRLETDPEATPGLREEIEKEHADAEKRWEEHFKRADVKLGGILPRMESMGDRYTGEKFYERLTEMLKHSPRAASEHLDSVGVPGIVFLDQGSRGKQRPPYRGDTAWLEAARGFKDSGYSIEDTRKGMLKAYTSASASELNAAIDEAFDVKPETFNNYVMFDPERIKVVAKNGEVVRTVADDLPAPPPEPVVEPVTVAAMSAEDVKDDRDLSVAPMAAQGRNARYPWPWQRKGRPEPVAGYKPGGLLTPHAQLSKEVGNFTQERERREKAVAYRAEALVKDLERALRQGYGKQGPDTTQRHDVQMALGNLENRLTPEQYNESLKFTNLAERRSFIEAARHEAVDAARERQRVALGNLPDIVREKVNKLRKQLDLEAKELLKDPGLDTELRARIDSELGVFLHSNSYQHFESDVWGKHIKSDDPEALRIRRAAKALFKNEVIGEKAHEYQVANPGVSDAQALAHASALPNIDRMVENRLGAYLRKDANEVTRMHLLSGKITIPESGKLLSLNRENLPQEVRELWGQWTDPKINFAKTYTILANHNASIRMQHSIVEDGTRPDTGYIWKPDPADPNALPPADLIPLGKAGDYGPLADAYGPQYLKDGLANYSKPPVQDLMVDINRWALMMKTTGNIASAVHNFFGNIAFSISNGNLLWAVAMAPKTLISSAFRSFAVAGSRATGIGGQALQEEAAEMIELGVFDTDIAIGTLKKMSRAAQAGILVEKKLGPAAGLQAVMKVLHATGAKTGAAFKETYQAADNWWKYFNFRIELAKQEWIHSGDASVTLDQMKRNAANMVLDTLPSYSRVPEAVRRALGDESVFKYTGAFFTFQTESARTVVMNSRHVWREAVHGKNAKERSMAAWRLGGMIAMLSLPYALGLAARRMFGYDDDDERALRNSLPEYQKNASLLVMLPKDESKLPENEKGKGKGNPRYMDLSWLNPYGIFHSAGIAASRARHEGKGVGAAAGAAGWSAIQPLITVQPGVGTVMDLVRNQDSLRGGRQIYNPEDTFANQWKDVGLRAMQGLAPGTLQNAIKAVQSALGYVGKSGREPDPLQDITAGLAGLPRVSTLELDRAMETHVGVYKKTVSGAKALLNEVVATKATVQPGEVMAAYRQAQAQTLEHNIEMHRAYEGLLKLGMKKPEAIKAMRIGFGSEILKGGLGKDTIAEIINGRFSRVEVSDKMKMQAKKNGRLREYLDALKETKELYRVDEL